MDHGPDRPVWAGAEKPVQSCHPDHVASLILVGSQNFLDGLDQWQSDIDRFHDDRRNVFAVKSAASWHVHSSADQLRK